MTNIDTTRLKSFIERIDHLEEQKKAIQDDLKEVYKEAKNVGYKTKPLKKAYKIMKLSESPSGKDKLIEEQYWIDTYTTALGID